MNKINWQERLNQLLSTGKNKSFFTAGTTILFVVVMSIIGVIPALSSLGVQAEDNAKRDKIIDNLEQKLEDLKKLTVNEESKSDLIEYFEQIMPDGERQEETINLLNTLADKRNTLITSFTFDREDIELKDRTRIIYGEKIIPQHLSIITVGGKDDTLGFIKGIEDSARIMDIESFVVNRITVTDSNGIANGTAYELNLKLIIYYYE